MPEIKETHFFAPDLYPNDPKRICSWEKYNNLFAKVRQNHIAVGEASASYLYSSVAIDYITKYVEAPKFIVIIRNPIQMIQSFHYYFVFTGDIKIHDFETAWRLSPEEKMSQQSKNRKAPQFFNYQAQCSLGNLLQNLYQKVSHKQIQVLLLDDLKDNPKQTYLKTLQFLNVTDDGRDDFPSLNPTLGQRNLTLDYLIKTYCWIKTKIPFVKHLQTGLLNRISRINTTKKITMLSDQAVSELKEYFYDDILLLSRILKRDLMYWLDI